MSLGNERVEKVARRKSNHEMINQPRPFLKKGVHGEKDDMKKVNMRRTTPNQEFKNQ